MHKSNLEEYEYKLKLWQVLNPNEKVNSVMTCKKYCYLDHDAEKCNNMKKLAMCEKTGEIKEFNYSDRPDHWRCVEFIRGI